MKTEASTMTEWRETTLSSLLTTQGKSVPSALALQAQTMAEVTMRKRETVTTNYPPRLGSWNG